MFEAINNITTSRI